MNKRTAEEWGRLAVSLPGWRWMPGMLQRRRTGPCSGSRRSVDSDYYDTGHEARVMVGDTWPDPDDPATAGCLLELAGAPHRLLPTVEAWLSGAPVEGITSLGRAVIADVRDQWGRWPGGDA